ncbi:ACP S-malonyltransferase [Paenibacillus sp. FSL K6-1096]|uniref:ACP S-malonyltransferase n=1 Tax=Paenibacillus sp. FSL K6-1096 TaxID=2921460 RepID=UPI0030EB3617
MKKLALLFPGQGSQYVGMLRRYLNEASVTGIFEQARNLTGVDFKKLCLENVPGEALGTDIVQPLIYVASVALSVYANEHWRPEPAYAAGHSLGEYAALTFAGSLQFEDGLRIVSERGRLMQQASAGAGPSMAAIHGLDESIVEGICREASESQGTPLVVACYNTSTQQVISGDSAALSAALYLVKAHGGNGMVLPTSGPFHSELMKPAAEQFRQVLSQYHFSAPSIPVISNCKGLPFEVSRIHDDLAGQLTSPVRWNQTLNYLMHNQVSTCVEIGPKNVLSSMINKAYPGIKTFAVDWADDDQLLLQHLAERGVDDSAFISACIKSAVTTPNTNWNESEYINGVTRPYRVLQQLSHEAKQGHRFTEEQITQALEAILLIWRTKQVDTGEIEVRFSEIVSFLGEWNAPVLARFRAKAGIAHGI